MDVPVTHRNLQRPTRAGDRAYLEAIVRWGAPLEKPFEYLKEIAKPTLVVNGGKGRDHLPRELVHPAAGTAKRAADPLSGLRARFAISVSQAVRLARVDLSRWVVGDGQTDSAGRGPPEINLEESLRERNRRLFYQQMEN